MAGRAAKITPGNREHRLRVIKRRHQNGVKRFCGNRVSISPYSTGDISDEQSEDDDVE